MTLLALIRHMPTAWNAAGRLQGREDLPLAACSPETYYQGGPQGYVDYPAAP